MPEILTYTNHDKMEVARVVSKIEQATKDVDDNLLHVACLAVAIGVCFDEITSKQLSDGVQGASEWIALFADSVNGPTPKEKVN